MGAYKYWKGGVNGSADDTDGDWNNVGNWHGGVKPVTGDIVVFGEQAGVCDNSSTTKHAYGKHWSCYINVSQAAVDLAGLIITKGFTGCVGIDVVGTGGPLIIGITDELWFVGNETLYIRSGGGQAVPLAFHHSASGLMKISTSAAADVWSEIHLQDAGTLEIVNSCRVDKIHCGADFSGIVNIGTGVQDGAGNAVDLEVYSGTVYSGSKLGQVKNASIIELSSADVALYGNTLDIDNLLQILGTFTWRHTGQLKLLQLSGGIVQAVGDGEKTLGTGAATDIKVYGGKLDLSDAQSKIVLASGAKIVSRGEGIVIMPPNVETGFLPLLTTA